MKTFKQQTGITMIEVIIAVAIIGILSAFAVPAYNSYMVDARMTSVLNYADRVKTDAATFYQLNRKFPHSGGNTKKEIVNEDVVYALEHWAPRPQEATWIHVYIQPETFPGAGRHHALILEGSVDADGQVSWVCKQHPGFRKIPDQYNPTACTGTSSTPGY